MPCVAGLFCVYNPRLSAMRNPFARRRYFHQDRIAMSIADRYGLTHEYKTARRHRLTPIEALEDWDMLYPEDYKLFEE